jgi:hypothetical protein
MLFGYALHAMQSDIKRSRRWDNDYPRASMVYEGSPRKLQNGFQRQSSARIYKKVHEFCMGCDGVDCEKCKLMEFVQYALIKKQL